MIQLVLLACLLKAPDRCESYQVPTEPMTLMMCAVTGQALVVQWAEEHPVWHVRSWRCDVPHA